MRFLAAVLTTLTLNGMAHAQSLECKTLTDPAAWLTCYDKINACPDERHLPGLLIGPWETNAASSL